MKTDLLIVGGGYAGLSAAVAAAREGVKTTVLERYDAIGKISRCGGGTFANEVSAHFDVAPISQKVNKVAFISKTCEHERCMPEIGLVVLDTVAYLKKMEKLALDSGVEILCGHDVRGIVKKGPRVAGVAVKTSNGIKEFSADMTIDCSGVARAVFGECKGKLKDGQKAFGIEIELDRQDDPERGELIVGDKDAPTGYAWIFPCPHGRTRIGVGFIDSRYWRLADQYLEHVIENRTRTLKKAKRVLRRGGFVPCHYPIKNPLCEGYAAAGDSAGQISLITGDGTRFALKWGCIIGTTCARMICGSKDEAVREFQKDWAECRRSLIGQFFMNRLMAKLSDSQWDWAVSKLAGVSNATLSGLLKGTFPMGEVARRVRRRIFKI